jgi:hypothetical protein
VIPSIGREMLANRIKRCVGTGGIAEHGLDGGREVVAREQIEQALLNVAPKLGHDDRQPIQNGIFGPAGPAAENAGADIPVIPHIDHIEM